MKLSLKSRNLNVFDGATVVDSAKLAMEGPSMLDSTSMSAVTASKTPRRGGVDKGTTFQQPGPTDVVSLDLSNNFLQVLIGGNYMKFLTELNVSRNCLASLVSVPQTVKRLTVTHNELKTLDGLTNLHQLQYLDFSHNEISELGTGLSQPPTTLTTVLASHNKLTTGRGFIRCQSLLKLSLDHNRISHLEELSVLGGLRALRHLTVSGNPVASNPKLLQVLTTSIGKLTTLDSMTMSQANANRLMIVEREREAQQRARGGPIGSRAGSEVSRSGRSISRSRSVDPPSANTAAATPTPGLKSIYKDPRSSGRLGNTPGGGLNNRSEVAGGGGLDDVSRISRGSTLAPSGYGGEDRDDDDQLELEEEHAKEVELRALEARVAELRRLATESKDREASIKKKNHQLHSQLRRVQEVQDEQDQELEKLRDENDVLAHKAHSLQRTVESLDSAFKTQHASVVYSKLFSKQMNRQLENNSSAQRGRSTDRKSRRDGKENENKYPAAKRNSQQRPPSSTFSRAPKTPMNQVTRR